MAKLGHVPATRKIGEKVRHLVDFFACGIPTNGKKSILRRSWDFTIEKVRR